MASPPPPTKSQVTKAGKVLRDFFYDEADGGPAASDATDALNTVEAWRKAHANPLLTANMGLRSRLDTLGCSTKPAQRLKRLATIINKLGREPGMSLGRMGDIGGCRAILDSTDDIYRVLDRYEKRSAQIVRRKKDYIQEPRASGYRAVHFNVEYKGFLTEIQLRTRAMHEWAVMVENMSSRTNQDIKSGRGPQVVQDWFAKVAEAMAIEERGLTVSDTLGDEIAALRAQALPLLIRPREG